MKEEEKLRDVLELFADNFLPALDCDGCTRFVSYLLENKKIEFDIYEGSIYETNNKSNSFPIHNWIKTKKGTIFDFKTKKWLGVTSDKVTYVDVKNLDKKEFLPKERTTTLGILLHFGIEAPLIIGAVRKTH